MKFTDRASYRKAIQSRDQIDLDSVFLIKYRVHQTGQASPDRIAVDVAVSLVPGIFNKLPWFEQIDEHVIIIDIAEHPDSCTFEVAIPIDQLGHRINIPQLLAIAWLPSEYGATANVWVEDIRFPKRLIRTMSGPMFGTEGIFSCVSHNGTLPLVSGIVKPRHGGDIDQFLGAARTALTSGLSGLVDDELIYDPTTSFSYKERIRKISEIVHSVSDQTSIARYYIPNIISPLREVESALQEAKSHGIMGVMTNSFSMGYAGFEYFCDVASDLSMFVIDCSIGGTMMSLPSEKTGTSMELLAKISRYLGADGIHTGSPGEHWYNSGIIRRVLANITTPVGPIKESLPVVAGGVNMATIWNKARVFGERSMVNVGVGLWAHPDGVGVAVEHLMAALTCTALDNDTHEASEQLDRLIRRDRKFSNAMDYFGYER